MDDSRLLQELNLIARQPRSAPHHALRGCLAIKFDHSYYCRLANVGLVNLTGMPS